MKKYIIIIILISIILILINKISQFKNEKFYTSGRTIKIKQTNHDKGWNWKMETETLGVIDNPNENFPTLKFNQGDTVFFHINTTNMHWFGLREINDDGSEGTQILGNDKFNKPKASKDVEGGQGGEKKIYEWNIPLNSTSKYRYFCPPHESSMKGDIVINKIVKQNNITEKPATTTEKPATTTEKPATTTEKPATTTEKPATTTEKPATTTEKPATTTEKPATTTEKPATTTAKPATTTAKPATTTAKPATTTAKPATTTAKPVTTTAKPVTTMAPTRTADSKNSILTVFVNGMANLAENNKGPSRYNLKIVSDENNEVNLYDKYLSGGWGYRQFFPTLKFNYDLNKKIRFVPVLDGYPVSSFIIYGPVSEDERLDKPGGFNKIINNIKNFNENLNDYNQGEYEDIKIVYPTKNYYNNNWPGKLILENSENDEIHVEFGINKYISTSDSSKYPIFMPTYTENDNFILQKLRDEKINPDELEIYKLSGNFDGTIIFSKPGLYYYFDTNNNDLNDVYNNEIPYYGKIIIKENQMPLSVTDEEIPLGLLSLKKRIKMINYQKIT